MFEKSGNFIFNWKWQLYFSKSSKSIPSILDDRGSANSLLCDLIVFGFQSFRSSSQDEASFFELQSRRERLQHVLERRQQAAVIEATTSNPTSTAVPETTTQATPEAIPDTKEPKKKKKKKKSKKPEDPNVNWKLTIV